MLTIICIPVYRPSGANEYTKTWWNIYFTIDGGEIIMFTPTAETRSFYKRNNGKGGKSPISPWVIETMGFAQDKDIKRIAQMVAELNGIDCTSATVVKIDKWKPIKL